MPFLGFVFVVLFSGELFGVASAQGETLSLLSVQPVSLTEIRITASAPVTLPPDIGSSAFVVTDATGKPLHLTKLILQGPRIILFTVPQSPGERYLLTLSDTVRGKVPHGEGWRAIPLDEGAKSVAFSGFSFEQNEEEVPSPEPLVAPTTLAASVSEVPQVSSPTHMAPTMIFIVGGGLVGWYVSRKFRPES
ncbi:hypothetical protein A2635_04980 [Candidatus Peribacteria bacterium RIFCSPHIGHO2_01_FULL_51_9]|nr:MAG: hypothetical protein A2635_04980 [Candidatus Peribacteria bacterium RIFCSPHIGHO2_01_FULL_51_9]